jgi:hypothetical protein
MTSNYAQDPISNGHSSTTLQEKKLIWIEKQMRKKREKAMKVGDANLGIIFICTYL